MKSLAYLLLISLFPIVASAQTILISDIDDTLKMSHVNSAVDRYDEAMKVNNPFFQMPELLRSLAVDKKVFYVSNAPQSVMGAAHRRFLAHNQFPSGEVHLREGIWADRDKKPVLRKILEQERPFTVILLGDNAEQDPEFYSDLRAEFPWIQFKIFIRWVYDPATASKFYPGQVPFVAPGEVALELNREGLLSDGLTLDLLQAGAEDLKLPAWANCVGHQPTIEVKESWRLWAEKLSTSIQTRCNP